VNTEYNGWRNIETWRVQLHLQNNEALYSLAAGMALAAIQGQQAEPERDATRVLAVRLETHVCSALEEMLPDPEGDGLDMLLADMVTGSLKRVDWDEIARHWIAAVGQSRASKLGGART
jgi:hypothetical protein